MPRVHVRHFALLRERLGEGATRTVRSGTTVGALWKRTVERAPSLAALQVRFAVNERYVEPDHVLADGDELAVFPPVSGGA